MQYVSFTHESYGQLETSVQSYIEYNMFDATDSEGNSYVVYKEDCQDATVSTY